MISEGDSHLEIENEVPIGVFSHLWTVLV